MCAGAAIERLQNGRDHQVLWTCSAFTLAASSGVVQLGVSSSVICVAPHLIPQSSALKVVLGMEGLAIPQMQLLRRTQATQSHSRMDRCVSWIKQSEQSPFFLLTLSFRRSWLRNESALSVVNCGVISSLWKVLQEEWTRIVVCSLTDHWWTYRDYSGDKNFAVIPSFRTVSLCEKVRSIYWSKGINSCLSLISSVLLFCHCLARSLSVRQSCQENISRSPAD